jgi:hypothetical protein
MEYSTEDDGMDWLSQLQENMEEMYNLTQYFEDEVMNLPTDEDDCSDYQEPNGTISEELAICICSFDTIRQYPGLNSIYRGNSGAERN